MNEAINELLRNKCVEVIDEVPDIINPLSVSIHSVSIHSVSIQSIQERNDLF